MIVAGATVSGIAAVAGWLILGGRRREKERAGARPASAAAPGAGTDVDVERLLDAAESDRRGRRARSAPSAGPALLWEAEDDRPRWVRRLDDQNPARPLPRRSDRGTWNDDDGDEDVPR
jgi:hypothetical protein